MPIPLGTTQFYSKVSSFLQLQRLSCSEQPKDVKRHWELLLHIDNYCNIPPENNTALARWWRWRPSIQSKHTWKTRFLLFLSKAALYTFMSVSRNGVYNIYDHMHVAFPRIMPPNHTTNRTHDFEAMFWNISCTGTYQRYNIMKMMIMMIVKMLYTHICILCIYIYIQYMYYLFFSARATLPM